jgi:nicotinamide mononucleotide (NMN) deamidase PncC
MAQGRLEGKVAVVTGGKMQALIAKMPGAAERAHFVAADVGVKVQVQGVVHEAVRRFGASTWWWPMPRASRR